MIANELKQDLYAVVIGDNVEEALKELSTHGVTNVIKVSSPLYREYNTETYANAKGELANKYNPDVVMIGATSRGRD